MSPTILVGLTVAYLTPPPCGTGLGARGALRAVLEQLRPGTPIARVRELAEPFQAEKDWGGRPYRETYWLVSVADGRRSALETVSCEFDSHDVVIRCDPSGDAIEVQTVTLEQWQAVRDGISVREALGKLCSPSGVKKDGEGRVFAEWMVEMPKGHAFGSCLGQRFIEAGRVERKELLCE